MFEGPPETAQRLLRWLVPGRDGDVVAGAQRFRGTTVFGLYILEQQKIKPIVARRFPLAEARLAHELLGKGGVTGKLVLVPNKASPGIRASFDPQDARV